MLRATCLAEGARPAVRFLLTGDADAAAEHRLLELDADVRADVLKVPHHGSRTSSSAAFLDAVEPVLAVASIGRGNRFGHPAAEVVARYIDRGIPLLRTDRDGSIVIRAGPSGPEVVAP
jgi:competence protein ComEC